MNPLNFLPVVGLLLVGPTAAWSIDGSVEINQTCAVHTGCATGDVPGFPVTIGAPGSYTLTSNLNVSDANQHAISISADDVSLDLAGFQIAGPVVCLGAGTTLSCSFPGSTGRGVEAPAQKRVQLFDGLVGGFGGTGVELGELAHVRDLMARWNGATGVVVGNHSVVSRVFSDKNGGDGISAGSDVVIDRCITPRNRDHGVATSTGASIRLTSSYENGKDGVYAGSGSVVREVIAHDNEDDGIEVESGSQVSDSVARENKFSGIEASVGSNIVGNMADRNGTFGLSLAASTAYHENTVPASGGGGTVSGGLNRSANSCNGTATCP